MDLSKAFLCGRTYSVIANRSKSGDKSLLCWVPHGSIIGPLLFILYIEDVTRLANKFNFKILLCADDTTIYVGFNPMNKISSSIRNINLCTSEVKLWILRDFMNLNVEKTQNVFSGKPEILEPHQSNLQKLEGSLDLSQLQGRHKKFLGVYIYQTLTFDSVVANVCRDGYLELGVLRNMRNFFSKNLKLCWWNVTWFPRLTTTTRCMYV